jgi:IS5 family transposase
MKTDGCLSRCALKGTLGDALHAVLCGCGHNIRMILAHLRAIWAEILAVYYAMFGTKGGQIANQTDLRPLAA